MKCISMINEKILQALYNKCGGVFQLVVPAEVLSAGTAAPLSQSPIEDGGSKQLGTPVWEYVQRVKRSPKFGNA